MLGNQAAVIKGAPHPNAAKLFIEYLLSKPGTDVFVVGEMMYSFMKDYTPPPEAQQYLFDMKKTKMIGLKDWVAAQGEVQAIAGRLAGEVPVATRRSRRRAPLSSGGARPRGRSRLTVHRRRRTVR